MHVSGHLFTKTGELWERTDGQGFTRCSLVSREVHRSAESDAILAQALMEP